jgi:hypothetical protein
VAISLTSLGECVNRLSDGLEGFAPSEGPGFVDRKQDVLVVTMRSQALAASLVSALARCRTALGEAEPGQMWRPEALAFDSISSSTKWSSPRAALPRCDQKRGRRRDNRGTFRFHGLVRFLKIGFGSTQARLRR